MIIIRHKFAERINNTLYLPKERIVFSNLILNSNQVNIIYFDKKIESKTFIKGSWAKAFILLGELERKDVPFIILINRKCYIEDGEFLTVTNANCIPWALFESYFPEMTNITAQSKSLLYNKIFKEYVDYEYRVSFAEHFTSFVKMAAYDSLVPKELVFIAFSPDGQIFNANSSIGRAFDKGKLWLFDEDYTYDAMKVDTVSSKSTIEKFSAFYEARNYLTYHKILQYNEAELTEIIKKYPVLFADFAKKGTSVYDKDYYDYIDQFPEEFQLQVDSQVVEEEDETDLFLDEIDEYDEVVRDSPRGYKPCFSCSNFFEEKELDYYNFDGKDAGICIQCATGAGCTIRDY